MPNIPIQCTPKALDNIRHRCQAEEAVLRIYIEGGGCSGFQYQFELTTKPEDPTEDIVIAYPMDVYLVIDPLSFSLLKGATVDYQEDLLGSRFVVGNPNAQTTCSCGSSFSA